MVYERQYFLLDKPFALQQTSREVNGAKAAPW